jgi:hypothetical protein
VTVVELDVDGAISRVVRDDGGGLSWEPRTSECEAVRLCWSRGDAQRLAVGALSGTRAMAATRIADASRRTPELSLPPMGFVHAASAVEIPTMLGASLRAQFATTDGPFGAFSYVLELVDGVPSHEAFATAATADVVVTLPYQAIASVFAGSISVLEAIARGEVAGELAALAALAGVFESDEFRALMAQSAHTALTLAALGDLRTAPAFQLALAHVVSATSPA